MIIHVHEITSKFVISNQVWCHQQNVNLYWILISFKHGSLYIEQHLTCLWMQMLASYYHFLCLACTVYPKKYTHGFVVLCFVVVMQSFIINSHEVFIHIHQGCFAGTGAIVRLPQCQWSKPDEYGKISHGITTTKHSKAKTVCIFLGIYCKASTLPYPLCTCLLS